MHTAFLDQIDEFLKALGRKLDRLEVNRSAKTMSSVTVAVEAGCREILEEHAKAIAGYSLITRPGVMARTLQQLQESRIAVEGYAEYLGGKREELLAKLDLLKEGLRAQVDARMEALRVEELDVSEETPLAPSEATTPAVVADPGLVDGLVTFDLDATEEPVAAAPEAVSVPASADQLEEGLFLLPLDD
jgi:hypothetical protein